MLRCSIFTVFVFAVSAQALDLQLDWLSREKRQTLSFGFEFDESKQTFFTFNGQRLVQLTGGQSRNIILSESESVSCNTVTGELTSDSINFNPLVTNIAMCTNITGTTGVTSITMGAVEYTGPGRLYIGTTRVMFADDTTTIASQIEAARPTFPPVIPPLEVLVYPADGGLVLNLDDETAGDGFPNPQDDSIILTGSTCMRLEVGDSLVYAGDTITVLRGPNEILRRNPIEVLDEINEVIVGGARCNELRQSTGSRSEFIRGPGVLCTGMSGLNIGAPIGFFSNSQTINTMINSEIVRRQVRGTVETIGDQSRALLVGGDDTAFAGTTLVTQTGAETFSLAAASTQERDTDGSVVIRDASGNVLRTFSCFGTGVSFARYSMNMLELDAQGTTMIPSSNVDPDGLTVIFNPDTCEVFTYPTENAVITNIAAENLASVPTDPPTPIRFSTRSENFGVSFRADDELIFTPIPSQSSFIGSGQSIRYQNNRISIRDSSGAEISAVPGVGMLSVLTGLNRLSSFSGSSNNAFSGPGTLYVDNSGRAFFTGNSAVNSLIQNSITSVPRQRVDVVGGAEIDGVRDINFQVGGMNFFNYGPNTMTMSVQGNEGLIYRNGDLGVATAAVVPSGGMLVYNMTERFVQVISPTGAITMTITDVMTPFLAGRVDGGTLEPVTMSMNFPGGGVFYYGDMGSVYLPSTRIFENGFTAIMNSGAVSFMDSNRGLGMVSFFDGTSFRVFNNNSQTLLPGPGTLFRSGNDAFYTTSQSFLQGLSGQISRLRPVDVGYETTTGLVTVTSGSSNSSFSIGSQSIQLTGGGIITYSGGNIASSVLTNLIAGNITGLSYYDGFSIQTFGEGDNVEFPGGGLMYIDPVTRMAFYTTDRAAAIRISNAITGIQGTFVSPNIPIASPRTVASKFRDIEAAFGQTVTVYAGANVDLICNSGNANPPPTFSFSVRDPTDPIFNETFVDVIESGNVMIIMGGPNQATLRLVNVMEGTIEYRCQASNPAGNSISFSRVIVRPPDPPVINGAFFSGRPGANEVRATAQPVENQLRTIEPIIAPDDPAVTVIADTSLLTDTVTIGCKADGRPKARITWFSQAEGGAREPVNLTSPNFNASSIRQGQSFLSVAVNNFGCVTYFCDAENGGPVVMGQLRVCPRQYNTEVGSVTEIEPCTANARGCGIGAALLSQQYQLNNIVQVPGLTFRDLPAGLVKPIVNLCINSMMPQCPPTGYEFRTSEFGDCDVVCGRGSRSRMVQCIFFDGTSETVVNDTECIRRGLTRPSDTQRCDIPCPVYRAMDFGPCSRTCRSGIRTREVLCLNATLSIDENNNTMYVIDDNLVDISVCREFSLEVEPVSMEVCNSDILCPVRFLAGTYGPCDQFFCQERNVTCVNFDPSDPTEIWVTNTSVCVDQGLVAPPSVRSCDGGLCNFGRLDIISMGECSVRCGVGVRPITMACLNADGEEIEDGYCAFSGIPATYIRCFLRNCPGFCQSEPSICRYIAARGFCKRDDLTDMTQSCCRSCPLQATPIPPLPPVVDEEDETTMMPTTMVVTT